MMAKNIVKNFMETDNLPIAKPDDNISKVLPMMVNRRLALVIVMENEQFLGIVTGGDLQRSIIDNEANFVYLKMEQIMNTNPITINENSSIANAEKLFKKNNIIVLIVTNNNGKLVGVLRK
jgi:arabinose-5-phosphate isomerase